MFCYYTSNINNSTLKNLLHIPKYLNNICSSLINNKLGNIVYQVFYYECGISLEHGRDWNQTVWS